MKFFTTTKLSSLFLSLALGLSACGQNNPGDLPECGNGTLEDGEQCDDGDNNSFDGCSSDCELEEDECGNGTLNVGEQCDDGNSISGDGCSSGCNIEGPSEAEQINEYIEGLGTLNNPAPQPETPEGAESNTSYGPYTCTTQNFRQVKVIDSFKLQGGAMQDRIYPGMLLSGLSLAGGDFTEVVVDKKPLTMSHDVTQLPQASIVMQDPTLSEFTQARTDLLSAQIGQQSFTPKFANHFIEKANNTDELSLSLGVDVSAGIATEVDVVGSFNFENNTVQSRHLVRIVNELYTLKIDPVSFASDFFDDSVTLQQVQSLFQTGAPPVYVDTITYGREIYITIESNFSETELQAALDTAISGGATDVKLDFGLTSKEVLQNSTILAVAVGPVTGDIADIGALSGANADVAINSLLTREAQLSIANLGQPISFTTRYLPSAFGNANSIIDATYPIESCTRRPVDFGIEVASMIVTGIGDGNSTDAEIRGRMSVKNEQNFFNFFQRNAGQEVVFSEGDVPSLATKFRTGDLQDVDVTFGAGNFVTIEYLLEEDDRPNLVNNDQGDGIDNDGDDIGSLISQTIAIEDLYQNGGQITLNPVNSAGIAFNIVLNFTPDAPLFP